MAYTNPVAGMWLPEMSDYPELVEIYNKIEATIDEYKGFQEKSYPSDDARAWRKYNAKDASYQRNIDRLKNRFMALALEHGFDL